MVKHTHLNRIVIHIRTIFYIQFHSCLINKNICPADLLTLRSAAVFPLCWVQPYGIESLYTSTKAISWGSTWNVETLHSSATRVWKPKIKCTTSTPTAHCLQVPFISKCCVVFFKFFFMHPSHLSFHFRDVHFNVMWATSFAGCNSSPWQREIVHAKDFQNSNGSPHLMSRIPRKLSAHALRLRVDSPHGFATSSTKKKESKWFMAEATSPNYWVVVVGYYCWWFRNPANQLRLVVDPIIYKVLYIPGGYWDFWTINSMKATHICHFKCRGSRACTDCCWNCSERQIVVLQHC